MNRLDEKIALISGAASGIGAETARTMARAGAVVVVADIDETGGEEVAAEICAAGGSASFHRLDVTKEDDWKSTVAVILERLGGLDILVNNAGIECIATIEELTLDEWHRVCHINLDGVFLGTKYAMKAMTDPAAKRPRGGSIINLSSIAGIVGTPGQSAYNMTKGGVRLFTKSAALECAALGLEIRVNSVHPGVIQTPMVDQAWEGWTRVGFGEDVQKTRENILALHPIGRLGRADDIANAILYLASDDSSFVTGTELVVDGGLTAA